MKVHDTYKKFRSFIFKDNTLSPKQTDLIVEAPLELYINGEKYILTMFTPKMTKELVVGFLFTEGIINSVSEIEKCVISPTQKEDGEHFFEAHVTILSNRSLPMATTGKRISYSSCGICGTENYFQLKNALPRVKSRCRFSMEIVKGFLARMQEFQPLYRKTGGAHAAILFDREGVPIFHCEDMGRHNALDKIIGYSLLNGVSCEDKIIFSSGRASLEMILKTARVGCPLFVAKARPTSRAVEAAKYYNITLIDLAKDTNRVHSHARRIQGF